MVGALNDAGIPVFAWLLLPEGQGYWFNADDLPQSVGRYAAFQPLSWDELVRDLRLAPQVGSIGEIGFPDGDL